MCWRDSVYLRTLTDKGVPKRQGSASDERNDFVSKSNKSTLGVRLVLSTNASLMLFGSPAATLAQDANQPVAEVSDARSDREVSEIIVTASGRSETASSIPFNVTALGEDELREGNITDVKRLIELSPSINAPGNGARFADSVTVRGLNVSPVNANNIEQFSRTTLAYYLDDTPLPNLGYRIKDIERVETLLGPQGTLYGAGSLGGTIRFITNKPRFGELSGRVSTSIFVAKNGGLSHDTDAVINIPLSENLAFRGSVARLDDEGYVDRLSNPPFRQGDLAWTTFPDSNRNLYEDSDSNRVTSGRASLAWQATDMIKITLAHAQQDQRANGTSATSLQPLGIANARNQDEIDGYIRDPINEPDQLPCAPNCQFTGTYDTPTLAGRDVIVARYPEFARRKFRLSSADLDIDLGFADLHSSTSIFKDSRVGQADYAGPGYTFYFSFGDSGAAFDSNRSAFLTFDNTYEGLNHETRLTSQGGGPFQWIAGFYYTDTDRSFKFSEFLPGLDDYIALDRVAAGGIVDEGYRENLGSEYQELAAYGELSYDITPRWTTTIGARVFRYEDRAISQIRDYTFDLVNNFVDVTRKDNFQSYYKFNTSYDITDDALVYATISQGFRRGGTNGFRNVDGKTVDPDILAYAPDSTTNYEIGLKGYFADRRLLVQADAYQIEWDDVQTYFSQEIDFFPVNGTANGPSARTRGVEAQATAFITEALTAGVATSFTEAKWSATKEVCLYTDDTACRTYLKGGVLGGSPKWKHSGFIRYEAPISSDAVGFAAINGRYVGEVPIDRADDPRVTLDTYPSYAIFDLRAGITFGKIAASIWIENVANKRARVSQQFDRVLGGRIFYTQPRTVGVNLSYEF